MVNSHIGASMPSSPEKQKAYSQSPSTQVSVSRQQANTLYALASSDQKADPSTAEWMTCEQARAWLFSDQMPPTRRHVVLMKCPVCGTHFIRSPSKLRAHKDQCERLTHTCSNACMGVMRTEQRTVTLACDVCGVDFSLPRSTYEARLARGNKHHFCSRECNGEYRSKEIVGEKHPRYSKVELTCTQCKKPFLRGYYAAQSFTTKRPFCSQSCYHTWQVGRPTEKDTGRGSLRSYPPEFKLARRKMREEKALCVVCMYPATQLHHKDEDIENNDPQNLAPVCFRCHKRHHASTPHPLLSPSPTRKARSK